MTGPRDRDRDRDGGGSDASGGAVGVDGDEPGRGHAGHRRASTWGERYFPKPGPVGRAFASYCAIVHDKFRQFTLTGLARTREPIDLRDVYVRLMLAPEPVDDAADDDAVRHGAGSLLDWLERHSALVISGLPGSGKTTLARDLIAELAASRTTDATRALPDHLPVPILLRDHDIDSIDSMEALIEQWFAREARDDRYPYDRAELQPFFDQGRFVLVLDGLDELGTLARRERVWRWLADYQRAHDGQGYYLVTSRPSGLEGLPQEHRPGGAVMIGARSAIVFAVDTDAARIANAGVPTATRLHIRPLADDAIGKFCQKFFDLPIYRREDGARKADELHRSVLARPDLRVLARRPAFLTMMAFVHANVGELPDTRAELYDRLVETYLHVLDQVRDLDDKQPDPDRPRWPHAEKRNLLAMLAFVAHRTAAEAGGQAPADNDGDGGGDRQARLFAWERPALVRLIAELLAHPTFKVAQPEHAASLLDYLLARTGLLATPAEGVVQFGHLSFQEYLAAVYLHARASTSPAKAAWFAKNILARLDGPGWDEVATLFMAIDARQTQGEGHRALLPELDLSSERQVLWLSRLLGGREVPFSPEERSLWIAALMGAAMAHGWPDVGEPLARLPENRDAVAHWFRAACIPWRDGESPLWRLRAALSDARPASGALAVLDDDDLADDPASALRERILSAKLWTREPEPVDALAIAALIVVAADAANAFHDDELASAVPPTLMTVRDGKLLVATAYIALPSLLGPDNHALARALHRASHVATWLIDADREAMVRRLAPLLPAAATMRETISVALAVSSLWPLSGSDPHEASWRRWRHSRAEAEQTTFCLSDDMPLYDASWVAMDRAHEVLGHRTNPRGPLEFELDRLRTLPENQDPLQWMRAFLWASALAQDVQQPALSRALDRARSVVRSPLFLAPLVSEPESAGSEAAAGAEERSPASQPPQVAPPHRDRASGDRGGEHGRPPQAHQAAAVPQPTSLAPAPGALERILSCFALLAEARQFSPADRTPITRERAERALAMLTDPSWLDAYPDADRYKRELAECRQLGLLPIDVLRDALADDSLWTRAWTLDDAFAELGRQLQAWCDDAERAAASADSGDADAAADDGDDGSPPVVTA